MRLPAKPSVFLLAIAMTSLLSLDLLAQHEVLMQGNDTLAIVGKDGKVSWEMKWGGIHDVHVLPSGNIMVQQSMKKVVEIDRKTKKVV